MNRLRCVGVWKRFGGVHAVRDLSLEFPDSGIVAIVGPNGAGKTTLLNIMAGFLRADTGEVFIGDEMISRLSPRGIVSKGMSRTFQELRVIRSMSILENLMLAMPNQGGERISRALFGWSWQLKERQNREVCQCLLKRLGLGGFDDRPASDLSYGQQKMLSLGCCLATGSQILLLDEPVSGIHGTLMQEIVILLKELGSEGKLVVAVEHDLEFVRQVASRVIVMDDGCVIADGDPRQVLERPDVLEAYVG